MGRKSGQKLCKNILSVQKRIYEIEETIDGVYSAIIDPKTDGNEHLIKTTADSIQRAQSMLRMARSHLKDARQANDQRLLELSQKHTAPD